MQVGEIWFLGVSTGSSTIHRALPRWGVELGRPLRVRGVDLPVGAPAEDYRRFCERLATDSAALGAVVTTHKAALHRAAHSHFCQVDPLANLTAEINAIRRDPDGLSGFARDPVSVGRVVDRIWPGCDRQVVCLGGGGTAIALLAHLARQAVRPSAVTVCETDHSQVEELRRFTVRLDTDVPIIVRDDSDRGTWDAVVRAAQPGSLIVNATGLGKDRPGSPVTDNVAFPTGAVAWELNYRGDLHFLRLASQGSGRTAHDGWALFCHGWAAALTAILDLPDDPGLADRLAARIPDLAPQRPP